MSEENNNYENNNQDPQYTQVDHTPYQEPVYNGEVNNYSSGKGQSQGLGIASMVLGIVSLVTICCIPYAPIILGIIAIVLGIVQIVKNESKGMAIAGIACGAVALVAYIFLLVLGMAIISSGEYSNLLEQLQQLENYGY